MEVPAIGHVRNQTQLQVTDLRQSSQESTGLSRGRSGVRLEGQIHLGVPSSNPPSSSAAETTIDTELQTDFGCARLAQNDVIRKRPAASLTSFL